MHQNAQFPIRVNAQVEVPNPDFAAWQVERDKILGTQEGYAWEREHKKPAKALYVREDCYCHGWFAEWSSDDGQPSSCVMGLIERADGTMQTVWVNNIRLLNPTTTVQ